MPSSRYRISVVVPVYNESAGIRAFHERASKALDSLPGAAWELVYVDDGSADGSFALLASFASADPRVRVVKLSRNFGHQIAITAGLDRAAGDCAVVIDSDLQDPPEVIGRMVEKWQAGFDVVYGVRSKRRGEGAFKLITASAFYRLLDSITGIRIPVDVGDFRLLSRRALNELNQLREKDRFVRGLVSWIGFPQAGVEYERDHRIAGETKYPVRKMFKFALDGITSFSTAPLKLATWLGYGTSFLAFLYLASVFVQRAMGVTVQGWATIMVALLFLGGVQLICLGIMGEYLGRVFNEIKPRPIYIVETVLGEPVTSDGASRPQ
ncbi:MAG TPA: glycosyltransferase family 2 protein [Myxococcota bacterium]|jgi:dolichol-phosphate mannosyltransferase